MRKKRIYTFGADDEKIRSLGQGWFITFTNGCFDMFHLGHLHLLTEASRIAHGAGSLLVVGVNTDRSASALKGWPRPIWDEWSRVLMVSERPEVDAVILFDDLTPERLLDVLSPMIVVKGGDYTANEVVAPTGARVEIVPTLPGWSTTNLIERIRGEAG